MGDGSAVSTFGVLVRDFMKIIRERPAVNMSRTCGGCGDGEDDDVVTLNHALTRRPARGCKTLRVALTNGGEHLPRWRYRTSIEAPLSLLASDILLCTDEPRHPQLAT